ncbi:MAG: hypothetical protein GDA36_00805 [Rhodobacteraceae bacterium]|nr:hypothetical protein [Paracoccaceae bacterium]
MPGYCHNLTRACEGNAQSMGSHLTVTRFSGREVLGQFITRHEETMALLLSDDPMWAAVQRENSTSSLKTELRALLERYDLTLLWGEFIAPIPVLNRLNLRSTPCLTPLLIGDATRFARMAARAT